MVKKYKRLYKEVCGCKNLLLAWKKARKGKTKKFYVLEFQKDLIDNLGLLQTELENETYQPKPLKTFILRDPKTRKISKANFRDRVIHHAVVNVLDPIFEKVFIYDSCANRIRKGPLFALKRLEQFIRKVSENGKPVSKMLNNNFVKGYCLKADIRHYFEEVNHEVLIGILQEKIGDEKLINLTRKILINGQVKDGVGMPLGNLTSQFLANVYLTRLDYFVKHTLRAKYYVRYVDDFVLLHKNKSQLEKWKIQINHFLQDELKIQLHPDKSRVIPISRGIDFVGFKVFYHYNLLRRRNVRKIISKIEKYKIGHITFEQLMESFLGWNAYAKWANSYKLRKKIVGMIYRAKKVKLA